MLPELRTVVRCNYAKKTHTLRDSLAMLSVSCGGRLLKLTDMLSLAGVSVDEASSISLIFLEPVEVTAFRYLRRRSTAQCSCSCLFSLRIQARGSEMQPLHS